jgi:hypothetical protein
MRGLNLPLGWYMFMPLSARLLWPGIVSAWGSSGWDWLLWFQWQEYHYCLQFHRPVIQISCFHDNEMQTIQRL